MALIIIIAVIAAAYFLVIKPKQQNASTSRSGGATPASTQVTSQQKTVNQPTRGVNLVPADALINSPYYEKYKTVFDLVWYDGRQPKYKIDWLLESLNMGRELENTGTYILDSIKADLPYFCETESEYDYFFKDDTPILRGSIQGMLDLMLQYRVGDEMKHPSKLAYWQQKIKEMAASGNMEAQAALCAAKDIPYYKSALTEGEPEDLYYNKYYHALILAADSGNPHAQLAIGEFLTPYASAARREMLGKATDADLTDAWYQLGKAFSSLIYSNEDGTWRGDTLPPDEKKILMEKEMECYIHAAEANNGIMAGWCQKHIAMWYEDGDGILPLDLKKAKYWYDKAAKNGIDVRFSLENLNKRLNG